MQCHFFVLAVVLGPKRPWLCLRLQFQNFFMRNSDKIRAVSRNKGTRCPESSRNSA